MRKIPIAITQLLTLDLAPFAQEACTTLGYLVPDAAEWLADEMVKYWNHGDPGYEIRRNGTELSKERKKELGLGYERFSGEVLLRLTDKGRSAPVHGLNVTCRRVWRMAHLRKSEIENERWAAMKPSPFKGVEFNTGPNPDFICSAATALNRKKLLFAEIPTLPLAYCDREVCGCWTRTITKREFV